MSRLRAGEELNLESDIIAKYVERILAVGKADAEKPQASGLTLERLGELGFK